MKDQDKYKIGGNANEFATKQVNLFVADQSEHREILKPFLEYTEAVVDYLPCEPSVLIDDYFKESL